MPMDAVIRGSEAHEAADLDLVERAQAGDPRAFETLVEGRFWRLNRLALSITVNEADARDALQEACLLAWRGLPGLRDSSRFDTWLWRIVLNACRSIVRDRRRVYVREIAMLDDESDEPADSSNPGLAEALSEGDLIRRAFERLDIDKRTILILHHVEERPLSDIAHLMRIPEGTAKWRLFAARRALERALKVERR